MFACLNCAEAGEYPGITTERQARDRERAAWHAAAEYFSPRINAHVMAEIAQECNRRYPVLRDDAESPTLPSL